MACQQPKIKLPIMTTVEGIDFTFERKSCGRDRCLHMPTPIGAGFTHILSQRIGICTQVTDFSVESWANSDGGQRQIERILKDRQKKADREQLTASVSLRAGDNISEYSPGLYRIVINSLSKEQAVAAYIATVATLDPA